ncbi:uncharacterized protein L3040_007281 [Drepanopeziza brunnea f. sp. 'multigermtubi']|uniref:Uncharacterized protein n=1 Tax=Marssonina brunnea f. sp. multigermtubi (strain MB_m1) TaxID=1072389 RepID=K1Y542_MARBU|nr:uncharacterized protein MBM_00951 [Drepanopeziza brunnea f. sp. 'multigermtubi' MB_m1]EKD20269.1 hypothetical protein MBM_00951 [Drepanopeziza brunnea f. sp. 'multigermtubi' MB_m1]KAJ5038419.1 hypothetical protein L3040_007281 [Drepanopeziza brunnea f. sp. 'multigermtubi']
MAVRICFPWIAHQRNFTKIALQIQRKSAPDMPRIIRPQRQDEALSHESITMDKYSLVPLGASSIFPEMLTAIYAADVVELVEAHLSCKEGLRQTPALERSPNCIYNLPVSS